MTWWIIATLIAFFIKGLCGFANTLIFTSILSFSNNNVNISPVELILGYPTNAIIAWKERKSIQWKVVLPLVLLFILGSIPGMLFLKNTDSTVIKIIFGFIIIAIGIEMMVREFSHKTGKQSKAVLTIIGIASGVLCGLYGIGALLGAYVSRVTDNTHEFKANMCTVFFLENTFRITLYSILGIVTLDVVKQAVIYMPFMLIGLVLGMLSGRVLNETVVKKIVIIMLIVSGIALVITNLI